MKKLTTYITEKFRINKNTVLIMMPKTFDELRHIIEDRYDKLGPGTEQKPIDFNDIDVSNINSFCNNIGHGIFEETNFEYIDISKWDVSNIRNMSGMFAYCKELKSVSDLSKWDDVSGVENTSFMFYECRNLKSVSDLSNWDVSSVKNMSYMFCECKQLKSAGDLSKWKVSKGKNTHYMFNNSGITNIPSWYKE